MPEKVLITGATGFIGSAVARNLVAKGYQLRAMVRRPDHLPNIEDLDIELVSPIIPSWGRESYLIPVF